MPDAQPGDQLYWSKENKLPSSPKPTRPTQKGRRTERRIPKNHVHAMVRGVKEHFENGRPIDDGAYLKPYKKLLVDVTSSKDCLEKALDFTNDLFNAFESAGYRVLIGTAHERFWRANVDQREVQKKHRNLFFYDGLWAPMRPTVVYIGDVAIGLSIIEMSEEVVVRYVRGKYIRDTDYVPPKTSHRLVDHTWTTTRDVPSGRLRLVAYSPYNQVDWSKHWQDTNTTSIRSTLKSIVRSIEGMAAELVGKLEEAERQAEIARQEWLAAEEKRRRKEDQRKIEQSIHGSRKHLEEIIQQWSNVMDIERFFKGVEQRVADIPNSDRSMIVERLKLARAFLGTQDPLDFFRSWQTPTEKYQPLFPENEVDPNVPLTTPDKSTTN